MSFTPFQLVHGVEVILYLNVKFLLSQSKFNPMWCNPYIVRCVFDKGYYKLEDYEGNILVEPHNGLYIKRYYA
jgi:hypothetical protein